jgi:hypothetical protein
MRYENALPRTVLDALRLLTNVRRQASQPGLSMLSIDAAVSGTPIVLYLSPAIRQRTEHRRDIARRYDMYTAPKFKLDRLCEDYYYITISSAPLPGRDTLSYPVR